MEGNIKGKVLEENSFMVKVVQDTGNEDIIPFQRILNVNKERRNYEKEERTAT
jgi:hypothetical protein